MILNVRSVTARCMHSTPPSPEEINEHVDWTIAAVTKLLAENAIAARVDRHEIRGVRRVIVTLDVNRPVLRREPNPAP